MSKWNSKDVNGRYDPAIGSNIPGVDYGGGPTDTYADIEYLRRALNTLLEETKELNDRLEEDMLDYALPIRAEDKKLSESHRKEWPSELSEMSDQISYRYYKALRFRNTTSASYIRQRYEEAARGVTGTNAIDVLEVTAIIRDEAFLIQEFLNAYIGDIDDSSEFRTIELFQDWVDSALTNLREFWTFFETRQASEEFLSSTEIDRTSADEAKQGQVVFKVKLNSYNSTIKKDIDFLKKNFSEFAPDFYKRFLGPAISYRLNVGRRALPTGGQLSREIERASVALNSNLRTVLADQMRRTDLFRNKLSKLRNDLTERDRYRSHIRQLALKGSPLPSTGPYVMVPTRESDAEVDYWRTIELQGPPDDEDTFFAFHSELEGLDEDDHPQYLLRSGGLLTGDVEMEDGTLIDGMRPSTHRHTGEDGTPQIHGKDIIPGTLPGDAVDQTEIPPAPTNLRVISHTAISRPPGVTVINTTVGWEGSTEHSYEVQITAVGWR